TTDRIATALSVCPLGKEKDAGIGTKASANDGRARPSVLFRTIVSATEPAAVTAIKAPGHALLVRQENRAMTHSNMMVMPRVFPAMVKNQATAVAAGLRWPAIQSSTGMSQASGTPPTRTDTHSRRATAKRPNTMART